jgi:phosphoribosylanthranilate isomerase
MPTWIKICGITNVDDALRVADAGANAIGLNFVRTSKRVIDYVTAAHIVDAVGDELEVVAVVADRSPAELAELRDATGIEWLQLHGHEPVTALAPVLPCAFKAVPVGSAEDVTLAASYAGDRVLVDAKVEGALGGTGHTFDWSLVRKLAKQRALILAGGLTPENVGSAVRKLRPWGVDVASGVEVVENPRAKHAGKVKAFIQAIRDADNEP